MNFTPAVLYLTSPFSVTLWNSTTESVLILYFFIMTKRFRPGFGSQSPIVHKFKNKLFGHRKKDSVCLFSYISFIDMLLITVTHLMI